jgi:hypothetical protein
MSENLNVGGRLTFYEGDKIIFQNVQNHITMAGLRHFASYFITSVNRTQSNDVTMYGVAFDAHMQAGIKDLPTTILTTALESGVRSTNVTGSAIHYDNKLDRYKVIFVGAWSAGVLPIVINEFGLYLTLFNNVQTYDALNSFNTTRGFQTGPVIDTWSSRLGHPSLFARVSIGDGQEGFDRPVSTNLNESYSLQWEVLI